MHYLILKTGHAIADTVADAISIGLGAPARLAQQVGEDDVAQADCIIGYGILRGTADVFDIAERLGKPWYVIDKGYFGAGHFDGFYRIGKRGTQTYRDHGASPISLNKIETTGECALVCPPTDAVCQFFGIDKQRWLAGAIAHAAGRRKEFLLREKGCDRSLEDDLSRAAYVYTFNSGVGWEAVSLGIQVVSNKEHSVVGQWEYRTSPETFIGNLLADQFTLDDVRKGRLCKYM